MQAAVGEGALADGASQQLDGILERQHVQRDRLHAVEAAEPSPAGDDDAGVRGAGQQRQHLRRVQGVVEQHEHPPVGELGPPQHGPVFRHGGHALGWYPQLPQQRTQRLAGVERRAVAVATQVQVELPVGEP